MSPQREVKNGQNNQTPGGLGLLLSLLFLSGFAISEPVLSVFGKSPAIFAFYGVESLPQRTLYALLIALLPPITLWAIVRLVQCFSAKAATILAYLMVASLAGLWFLQLWKWQFGLSQPISLSLLSLTGGVVVVLAYAYYASVRTFMRIAAIAPAVAAAVFLFGSQASDLGDTGRNAGGKPSGNSAGTTGSPTQAEPSTAKDTADTHYPSVLFILLDELSTLALLNSAGDIDQRRYSNLAALAGESTWFKRYTVLAEKTTMSVPSLLSGQEPKGTVASSKHYPTNLFALLAPTHHLAVFETVTKMCSYEKCSEGPPGADISKKEANLAALIKKSTSIWLKRVSLRETIEPQLDDFQEALVPVKMEPLKPQASLLSAIFRPEKLVGYAQVKPERVERLQKIFRPDGEPTLYFSHIELPHVPWRFYPDGSLYDVPVNKLAMAPSVNDNNEWLLKVFEYRFTLQTQYTDLLVGQLISKLKALDMWDSMLVIVSSDHGRSFAPNLSARTVSTQSIGSILYSPLFIKGPYQKQAAVDHSNLMAHDLLPTLAEILEIDLPWQVAGLGAGNAGIEARGDKKFYFPRKTAKGFGNAVGNKTFFSDAMSFPKYASRWIGEQREDGDNLALLNSSLGLDRYLGKPISEFESLTGGAASVEELARLRSPGTQKVPLGMVMGSLEFQPEGNRVLVAVNGKFVTGSPLFAFKETEHTFVAMLPHGILAAENSIEIFLVGDGTLHKLTLR